MIFFLKEFFSPENVEEGYSLEIYGGEGGSRFLLILFFIYISFFIFFNLFLFLFLFLDLLIRTRDNTITLFNPSLCGEISQTTCSNCGVWPTMTCCLQTASIISKTLVSNFNYFIFIFIFYLF